MSAIITLIVLAAAGWFLTRGAGGGRKPATREPMDSVHEFSRAMRALDPSRR